MTPENDVTMEDDNYTLIIESDDFNTKFKIREADDLEAAVAFLNGASIQCFGESFFQNREADDSMLSELKNRLDDLEDKVDSVLEEGIEDSDTLSWLKNHDENLEIIESHLEELEERVSDIEKQEVEISTRSESELFDFYEREDVKRAREIRRERKNEEDEEIEEVDSEPNSSVRATAEAMADDAPEPDEEVDQEEEIDEPDVDLEETEVVEDRYDEDVGFPDASSVESFKDSDVDEREKYVLSLIDRYEPVEINEITDKIFGVEASSGDPEYVAVMSMIQRLKDDEVIESEGREDSRKVRYCISGSMADCIPGTKSLDDIEIKNGEILICAVCYDISDGLSEAKDHRDEEGHDSFVTGNIPNDDWATYSTAKNIVRKKTGGEN